MIKVKVNITARVREFNATEYPYEATVRIIDVDSLPTVYLFDGKTKTIRQDFKHLDTSTNRITFIGSYTECQQFVRERLAELRDLELNWLLNFLYQDSTNIYVINNGNITIENEEV